MLEQITNAPRITKSLLAIHSEELAAPILEGAADPIKEFIRLKAAHDTIGAVLKDTRVKSAVLNAADNYGKNDRTMHGVKFELRGTPGKWDFSQDEDLSEMLEAKAEIEKRIKARQAALKAAYEADMTIAIESTGEVAKARELVTKTEQGQTIALSFPKE